MDCCMKGLWNFIYHYKCKVSAVEWASFSPLFPYQNSHEYPEYQKDFLFFLFAVGHHAGAAGKCPIVRSRHAVFYN